MIVTTCVIFRFLQPISDCLYTAILDPVGRLLLKLHQVANTGEQLLQDYFPCHNKKLFGFSCNMVHDPQYFRDVNRA